MEVYKKTEGVRFGTDGWRGIIADNYTFENVRRVALATARAFKDHSKIGNGIVIGYDTRFLSKEFAETVAEVFGNENIKVYLTDTFVTTPTVSLLSRELNLTLGVMITASHNPSKYNGYKLKDEFGGSMAPEEIARVEAELINISDYDCERKLADLISDGIVEYYEGRKFYINYLKNKIDVNTITKNGLKAIHETMYGAGQNMLASVVEVEQLHAELNPSFGKTPPEPVEKNLDEVRTKIKNGKYDIGLVTDGDADRIAIIDEEGNFLDAQKTFALLLKYLIEIKGLKGKVVRGFSTSELIKKICDKYNLELITVPIGFKHISKIMISDDVLIGAEESGGIGIKGHLPERDGIFNGLLYMEMLSAYKKSISELKAELDNEYGRYFYKRIDVLTTFEKREEVMTSCCDFKIGNTIAGKKILNVDNLDGQKFYFDNGWVLVRASGTEPLLRFYCETVGKDETQKILEDTIFNFGL